jgi:uncharacterized membrane protein YjjP (DUF1212 family)
MAHHKAPIPTRKWMVTQSAAVSALLVAWVSAGHWDKTLSIGLIGLFSQALASYLVPNVDAPGGVPATKSQNVSPVGAITS